MDALKIGLSEEEFWRLTPKTLSLYMEAYMWKRDQLLQPLSVFFAASINPHIQRPIKPTDLYRPMDYIEAQKSKEEKEADAKARFEKAVALMGPQAIPVIPVEERERLKREKIERFRLEQEAQFRKEGE